MSSVRIESFPEEILEHIFSFLCPYGDYKPCRLVCHRWHRIISGVANLKYQRFRESLISGRLTWNKFDRVSDRLTISDRYSHSACFVEGTLYVFGGCTANHTTFNDLWKFSLANKRWERPLAQGSYPSPKASAGMVHWKDYLVVYGGWTQRLPTPMLIPALKAASFDDDLHFYNISTSTWLAPTPTNSGPSVGVAGHSTCLFGDNMIVFAGCKDNMLSSNDLWSLNLDSLTWTKIECKDEESVPLPRYGAHMCSVSENSAVVLGGYSLPATKFSDFYLLTLDSPKTCIWTKIEQRDIQHMPHIPLWLHPACKVGNKMIILSRANEPITEEIREKLSAHRKAMAAESRQLQIQDSSAMSGTSTDSDEGEITNARAIRRRNRNSVLNRYATRFQPRKEMGSLHLLRNPMFLHCIDLSSLADGYVTWLKPNVTEVQGDGVDDTYFYSLVEGYGDLIMYGGVYSNEACEAMSRAALASSDSSLQRILNGSVYIISNTQ